MNRNPANFGHFIGVEVESSPYQGLKTLFIVGDCDIELMKAVFTAETCSHTYLAANQSFSLVDPCRWGTIAEAMLENGPVTLDMPISALAQRLVLPEKLHLMLSIYSPGIHSIRSYTLKLDDNVTNISNPGVWCVSKNVAERNFTPWAAYAADSSLRYQNSPGA